MLAFIIVVYILFAGIFGALIELQYTDKNNEWITPNYLYYDKELNWFGAYLVTILVGIGSPFVFIGKIIWLICIFFKWICTVGR